MEQSLGGGKACVRITFDSIENYVVMDNKSFVDTQKFEIVNVFKIKRKVNEERLQYETKGPKGRVTFVVDLNYNIKEYQITCFWINDKGYTQAWITFPEKM